MPTITNFGDLVTTGNAVVQGTGTSTFAGLVTFAQGFTTPSDVTVTSTLNSTNVVASGNISGANISSSANIWSTANVNAANIFATKNVSASCNVNGTNLYMTGNIWGANLTSSGNVWASSNVNGTNLYMTGNVWGGNFTSLYNIWAGSNVNGTNLYMTGNVSCGTLNVTGWSNLSTMNVVSANIANIYTTNITGFIGSQWTGIIGFPIYYLSNVGIGDSTPATANLQVTGNIISTNSVSTTNILAIGNISGANLTSTYNVWAGSNLNSTNVWATGNIWAANIASGGFRSNTTNTVITGTVNLSSLLVNGSAATTNQTIISTGTGAGVQWGTIVGSQWSTTGSDIYYTTGKVGIGSSSPGYPLHVSGTGQSKAAPYTNLAFQTDTWTQAYEPSTAATIKIFTDGNIGCTEVDVFSDRRIKDEIRDTNSERNLQIIKSLQVRDFSYIDKLEHGLATFTGLVAQEVKEVFEPAVSVHDGTIPSVFQVPVSFSNRTCVFRIKIENVQVGDKIKVLDESTEKVLEVLQVSDFEIEFSEELVGPRIFVYGQIVNDLHTVSYDRIVPVLISAVQELLKKVEAK